MCFFSKPKAPPPVAIPAAPQPVAQPQATPQTGDVQQQTSDLRERQKRLRASQASSTLVTGGQGLTSQASTTAPAVTGY